MYTNMKIYMICMQIYIYVYIHIGALFALLRDAHIHAYTHSSRRIRTWRSSTPNSRSSSAAATSTCSSPGALLSCPRATLTYIHSPIHTMHACMHAGIHLYVYTSMHACMQVPGPRSPAMSAAVSRNRSTAGSPAQALVSEGPGVCVCVCVCVKTNVYISVSSPYEMTPCLIYT